MDQDRIEYLLTKLLAGELTSEEEEELEWNKLANPRIMEVIRVLLSMRDQPPAGLSADDEQAMLEKGLQQWKSPVESRFMGMKAVPRSGAVGKEPRASSVEQEVIGMRGIVRGDGAGTGKTWKRWVVAASMLVIATTGVLYWHSGQQERGVRAAVAVQAKEIVTKYGTRSYQELPDGSKLWLNAGSKVVYSGDFLAGKREVTLRGEAFFDVRHDPKHPFIIHTGQVDVRVLGTTLNVRAYPEDSTIETTLINGKVEIDVKGRKEQTIVLRPSEKVSVAVGKNPDGQSGLNVPAGDGIRLRPVAPDSAYGTIVETSWVEDKLIFRNEQMAEVAARMERWYNIRIRFDNDRYQQQMLTGYFKDQPVENVMKALQVILGFHYKKENDMIHIW
ncbi:MAG TPA: FecR domain-containing protein [Puia sp.]|jgi:ferric-dicitrate binding protein FerR (iron transport regulator)